MLDTVDGWLPDTAVTFVEPYPGAGRRPAARRTTRRRVTIHREPVQDVDPAVFTALGPGDVLFIDSTHVVQGGLGREPPVLRGAAPAAGRACGCTSTTSSSRSSTPRLGARRAGLARGLPAAGVPHRQPTASPIRWFQDILWTRHRAALERLPWVARNPGANIWLERVG